MSKEVYLIVGLGNPGEEYAHTRHNAGFDTMALLEKHYQVTLGRKMLQGLLTEITQEDRKVVLCTPQTFMNASGECVAKLMRWYHCTSDHLLVIYDDIDLPPGRVRVRRGGGPGTHNGMRSIVEHLGGQDFPRIRVGVGDRPAGQDLADWVLGRPGVEDRPVMEAAFQKAAEAAIDWVAHGIDHAMQLGNQK
ncbi:MAG: aminoacyl-tRNA hydrolase [Clostridia bacterium]|nr:aminoacyl-tRNA hydrolase [Clostridia bacterium]